jgi:sugar phosphate permease
LEFEFFSSQTVTSTHKDQNFDDEGSDEDDHLLAIPTTPPPRSNKGPSPLIFEEEQKLPLKKKTATWKSLPRKGQLALLTISRLAEPLTQTSLQSYMFYQLKSFDMSQTDSQISVQAGMLAAAFTAAQFVTAIPWGRAADSELFGRKRVLIIGLIGTMISAIGFGFSRSFYTAMFFRTLGGALNGNVGVMRTVSFTVNRQDF